MLDKIKDFKTSLKMGFIIDGFFIMISSKFNYSKLRRVFSVKLHWALSKVLFKKKPILNKSLGLEKFYKNLIIRFGIKFNNSE